MYRFYDQKALISDSLVPKVLLSIQKPLNFRQKWKCNKVVAVQIEICADPPSLVASRLGVSVRTLTGWRKDLRKVLNRKEFDWINNEPSITAKSQAVLEKYQYLIEKLGKRKAIEHIRIYGV